MIDLTENEISKMIRHEIQNDSRFANCVLVSQDNYYIIEQIDLEPEVSIEYERNLDERSNAGIFHKEVNTSYQDGSSAWYKRDIQLADTRYVHLDIIFCRVDDIKSYVTIKSYYKDENIDLYKDKRSAKQLSTELLLPELSNILDIMNFKDINFQQDENEK